jgi:hypothetical protein
MSNFCKRFFCLCWFLCCKGSNRHKVEFESKFNDEFIDQQQQQLANKPSIPSLNNCPDDESPTTTEESTTSSMQPMGFDAEWKNSDMQS